MGESGMSDYYRQKLDIGQEYQDFIADQFWNMRHWPIQNYTSQRYQLMNGENPQGVEIKYDARMNETGNLYIEISECNEPGRPHIHSGIYAGHSICYLIGDYQRAFLFYTKTLQDIHKQDIYDVFTIDRTTSRGFLLPIKDVRKNNWMIEEIVFSKEVNDNER